LAIIANSKQVSFEHLEEAFKSKIWADVPATRNPFDKKFDRRLLNNVGECYAVGVYS